MITSSTPKKKKSTKRPLHGVPYQPRWPQSDVKETLTAEQENMLMFQNEIQQRKYDNFWGIDEDLRLRLFENKLMDIEDDCSRLSYEHSIRETQRQLWNDEFLEIFREETDFVYLKVDATAISNYMTKFYSLLDGTDGTPNRNKKLYSGIC